MSIINLKKQLYRSLTYLVIRRLSRKDGDPCLLGIDGERLRDLDQDREYDREQERLPYPLERDLDLDLL